MTEHPTEIHFVNHVGIDIDCSIDTVWAAILELRTGSLFSTIGATVEPIVDDPTAVLGGYRVSISDPAGAVLDERLCIVSECDDASHRLSIYATWLGPNKAGVTARVCYEAIEMPDGARYEIHCHVSQPVAIPDAEAREVLAARLETERTESDSFLRIALETTKAQLEEATR